MICPHTTVANGSHTHCWDLSFINFLWQESTNLLKNKLFNCVILILFGLFKLLLTNKWKSSSQSQPSCWTLITPMSSSCLGSALTLRTTFLSLSSPSWPMVTSSHSWSGKEEMKMPTFCLKWVCTPYCTIALYLHQNSDYFFSVCWIRVWEFIICWVCVWI